MNITNNGKKIVNIGELVLLPGQTAPLPKAYEGKSVVGFLISRGTLSCDQPFCAAAAQAPLKDDAAEEVAKEEAARVAAIEEQVRAVKKMNRGELDAACAEHGIEVEDGDTIPTLQKKLVAKLQEG